MKNENMDETISVEEAMADVEEKALEAYPYDIQGPYDANDDKRNGYIRGYREAIKNLMKNAIEVNIVGIKKQILNGSWGYAELEGNYREGDKVKLIIVNDICF